MLPERGATQKPPPGCQAHAAHLVADVAAQRERLEGARVAARDGVDVTDVDLDGRVVLRRDQALGPRAATEGVERRRNYQGKRPDTARAGCAAVRTARKKVVELWSDAVVVAAVAPPQMAGMATKTQTQARWGSTSDGPACQAAGCPQRPCVPRRGKKGPHFSAPPGSLAIYGGGTTPQSGRRRSAFCKKVLNFQGQTSIRSFGPPCQSFGPGNGGKLDLPQHHLRPPRLLGLAIDCGVCIVMLHLLIALKGAYF